MARFEALSPLIFDRRIVAAWAGDSRAVVGLRGSAGEGYQAHQLTADHKPESPSELARIAAAGGRVDRVATDAQGNPMGESGCESGPGSGHESVHCLCLAPTQSW